MWLSVVSGYIFASFFFFPIKKAGEMALTPKKLLPPCKPGHNTKKKKKKKKKTTKRTPQNVEEKNTVPVLSEPKERGLGNREWGTTIDTFFFFFFCCFVLFFFLSHTKQREPHF